MVVGHVAPPLIERYIVFPDAAPASITEKSVLAAKHEITELVNVGPVALAHGATASGSPLIIILPLLLFDASLPPISHRL